MFFTCNNSKKDEFICTLDGNLIKCENSPSGFYANIELEAGLHTLTIMKKTFFDTPLYYLNILNPLYFIYALKFIDGAKLGYDENYCAISVSFKSESENKARLNFDFKQKEHYIPNGKYCEILCQSYSGIKNVSVSDVPMDALKVRRYKLTRILSTLFYALILISLGILACIDGITNYLTMIIVSLIISLCCMIIIGRTLTEKSVKDNMRKNPTKRHNNR